MSTENFLRLHGPISLASKDHACWRCHQQTPVHCLLVSDVEEIAEGKEPMLSEAASFIHDLAPDALPAPIQAAIAGVASNFRPEFSRTTRKTTWSNVCVHCGALQGAFFLHSDPDGPFFGGSEEFSGTVQKLSDAGFDVDGATYSM